MQCPLPHSDIYEDRCACVFPNLRPGQLRERVRRAFFRVCQLHKPDRHKTHHSPCYVSRWSLSPEGVRTTHRIGTGRTALTDVGFQPYVSQFGRGTLRSSPLNLPASEIIAGRFCSPGLRFGSKPPLPVLRRREVSSRLSHRPWRGRVRSVSRPTRPFSTCCLRATHLRVMPIIRIPPKPSRGNVYKLWKRYLSWFSKLVPVISGGFGMFISSNKVGAMSERMPITGSF